MAWVLTQTTRDIRIARITAGMTQRQVGNALRRSHSWVSRLESGRTKRVSVMELARAAAVVGLKLSVATYPAYRRPLDGPQLDLLHRFNRRIHAGWRHRLEVPVPIPGDLRAVDEVIRMDGCVIAVEAYTRMADVGRQLRSARQKQRDIRADRLIILVGASHANRRMLRGAGAMLDEDLPIGTRAALRALSAGEDPGGDCLILL